MKASTCKVCQQELNPVCLLCGGKAYNHWRLCKSCHAAKVQSKAGRWENWKKSIEGLVASLMAMKLIVESLTREECENGKEIIRNELQKEFEFYPDWPEKKVI